MATGGGMQTEVHKQTNAVWGYVIPLQMAQKSERGLQVSEELGA